MTDVSATDSPIVWSEAGLELGEGPRWVDGRLVLVDILAGRLLEADGERPGPLREVLRLDVPLGAVAPVAGSDGTWIAAAGTGVALLDGSGRLDWIDRPAENREVPRRMNDATCDRAGRFWAGCMAWDASPGQGALYRTDTDGTVTQVWDGITIPNGPAFSPDGRLMYLADSARGVVHRFAVDLASGVLREPEEFLRFANGSPDGMTVDREGNLWVAIWGTARVQMFSAAGDLLRDLVVPALQPTAPCLGGRDGRRLFVTSAGYGMEQPGRSGDVFAIDVKIPGLPTSAFGSGHPHP